MKKADLSNIKNHKILFLGKSCEKIEKKFQEMNIPYARTEDPVTADYVNEGKFTFGVSYEYDHIITKDVIACFDGRLVNLHRSFLPWNRGSNPGLWSFAEKTPKGVTIHVVDSGINTGDILLQKQVTFDNISSESTLCSTDRTLAEEIENLFCKNLKTIIQDRFVRRKQTGNGSYHSRKQTEDYMSKLSKGSDTPVNEIPSAE